MSKPIKKHAQRENVPKQKLNNGNKQ